MVGPPEAEPMAADARIWAAVAADRFSGRRYDLLIDQLIRYALPKMRGWIGSGQIFARCRERNPQIRLWSPPAWTAQDHEELASSVVVRAIKRFHRSAAEGRGWSPTGGASLATYFLGMCIDEFPNQFRVWLAANRRQSLEDLVAEPMPVEFPAPDRALTAREEIRELFGPLRPPQRTAIYLQTQGYDHQEIAERMGRSVRAVEGLIRRGRRQLQDQRKART